MPRHGHDHVSSPKPDASSTRSRAHSIGVIVDSRPAGKWPLRTARRRAVSRPSANEVWPTLARAPMGLASPVDKCANAARAVWRRTQCGGVDRNGSQGGLPTVPYRGSSELELARSQQGASNPHWETRTAIVVDDQVCGPRLPRNVSRACARLGSLSRTRLLGIGLARKEDGSLGKSFNTWTQGVCTTRS